MTTREAGRLEVRRGRLIKQVADVHGLQVGDQLKLEVTLAVQANVEGLDIYFGADPIPPLAAEDWTDTVYDPGTLDYGTEYHWQLLARDSHGDSTVGPLWSFVTFAFACGDCNGDEAVTAADASYIVGFVYRGGPAPLGSADVNSDGNVTIADAAYIVSYIYRGGPPPCQLTQFPADEGEQD